MKLTPNKVYISIMPGMLRPYHKALYDIANTQEPSHGPQLMGVDWDKKCTSL